MRYSPNIARCQHIKVNGTQCGSPAVRSNHFCFFHKRWRDQRVSVSSSRKSGKAALELPVLEDANSVQVTLMQVMRLLLAGQIEHRTASLMLYGLQTASSNLRSANFEPAHKENIVIDPGSVDDTLLGDSIWSNADFEEEEDSGEEEEVEPASKESDTLDLLELAALAARARVS